MSGRALPLLWVIFASAGVCGAAEFFRWVDERGVVHFTDSLHNIPEKYRSKALRFQTPEPEKPPPSTRAQKATVPIQTRGQVVIVSATVNQKTKASFVVDTGASYTTISRATAHALDIQLDGKQPVAALQTANGVVEAPLVALESVDVGGLEVRGVTAAVHDIFPDATIAGLLGLNFLSQFRMDIDTKQSVLVLERR
ncbi:MAG TPA: TIGR02281 family clan AA aspartic protease [Candidatus Acidoferrales bacterium]|nr:TIGR02281 family clan AA aspartic protease [Candidatus Acidoferrales bacterium]